MTVETASNGSVKPDRSMLNGLVMVYNSSRPIKTKPDHYHFKKIFFRNEGTRFRTFDRVLIESLLKHLFQPNYLLKLCFQLYLMINLMLIKIIVLLLRP